MARAARKRLKDLSRGDNPPDSDPARRLPGVPLKEAEAEQERIGAQWETLKTIDFAQIEETLASITLKAARRLFGSRFENFLDYIKESGRIRAGPSDKVFASLIEDKGLFFNEAYLNDAAELTRSLIHEFGAFLGLPDWFNRYILETIAQLLLLFLRKTIDFQRI